MKFSFLIKLLAIFALLYDVNFVALPSFSTSRIALVALLIYALIKKIFLNIDIQYIGLLLVILSFSIIQSLMSYDFSQTSRILWFMLYGIVIPPIFISLVKDRNEFLYLITYAVSVQAILAIAYYINPGVKVIFKSLIIFTSNYDDEYVLRAMGFASVGGAGLSLIQSAGTISILLLLHFNSFNLIKRVFLWSLFVIITVSIFFIGRTGLLVTLAALAFYLISLKISFKNIGIALFALFLIGQFNYFQILESLTSNISGFDTEMFFEWIENSFALDNNETTKVLSEMPIPPVTVDTILGTGLVVDPSGTGNASGNDSGYIQSYYALGLILAIFFYLSYLFFLLKKSKILKSRIIYAIIITMFILEYKEPFIFYYSFPFFVLSLILVYNKNRELTFEQFKPLV